MPPFPTPDAVRAMQEDKTPVEVVATLEQWQVTMLERWSEHEGGNMPLGECIACAVSLMIGGYIHTHPDALPRSDE